jgi:hypothetical protein
VLDFLTATPAYPKSGISNPNLGVDPSGNTPFIGGPGVIITVSPFTFPPGTFATTSGQYITQSAVAPGAAFTGMSIHAWVHFPPGNPGLLSIGGDSTTPTNCSFYTQDGYATPGVPFGAACTWAIRIEW